MRSTSQGKNNAEYGGSEFALGRCLVDGDPEAASLARRTRRKSFGVSLTIEILLLVLLVAAPLFTSIAQPQLHQLLSPQLAFFGTWHEHSPTQHITSTAATREPAIPNPFPRADALVTTVHRSSEEEPLVPILDLPEGYIPGPIQVTEI